MSSQRSRSTVIVHRRLLICCASLIAVVLVGVTSCSDEQPSEVSKRKPETGRTSDLPTAGSAEPRGVLKSATLADGAGFGAGWISEPREEHLDLAEKHGLALTAIFGWSGERTKGIDAWLDFFARAQKRDIPIRISPIPAPSGAYLAARGAERDLAELQDFVDLYTSKGLKPSTLVLDVEGRDPGGTIPSITLLGLSDSPQARATLLAEALPVAEHQAAIDHYQRFVDKARAAGWRVGVSTVAVVADDSCDADTDIERVLGIPITGVDWDFVTFQAYRTSTYPTLKGLGLALPTSSYVYEIAKRAKEKWGDRAGVDLGLTWVNTLKGADEDDYDKIEDWYDDVRAAHAAGIDPNLVVPFRVEGFYDSAVPGDPEAWFVDVTGAVAPPPDAITDLMRSLNCNADKRLDADLHAAQTPGTTGDSPASSTGDTAGPR